MSIVSPENVVSIIKGSSKTFELSIVQDNGTPVDLTDCAIYFTVKVQMEDQLPVIQKRTTDATQIAITDPRSGIARIYINPEDTLPLAVKPHYFDVWLVLSSGTRYVVIPPSTIEIKPAITVIPV